ncbi:MAG TPA: hypothetical protein VFO62_00505 [Candidatus Binatia bacterium]|nr:hypothetical protein [Candidatus Binatia bacterium]
MLRFVIPYGKQQTMTAYLRDYAGDYASRIEVLSYDELFRSRRLPLVSHIFTDLERLDPESLEDAGYIWRALEKAKPSPRRLNHPLYGRRRYDLLRQLHEAGRNDFDVYRATEGRKPKRFPVFIRVEDDHAGPESDLLQNQAELDAALNSLLKEGKCLESRLIVEFCAKPGDDGVYRKYGVFYVDGAVIPRHIFGSAHWMVKGGSSFVDEGLAQEEARFLAENPHAKEVRDVFRLARLDYGRIDYGFVDGRMQVYEINSNPTIFTNGPWPKTAKKEQFAQALTQAYLRVEESTSQTDKVRWIEMKPPLKDWKGRLASRFCERVFGRQFRSRQ